MKNRILRCLITIVMFPISRDPPEGGTSTSMATGTYTFTVFPISRDPPEGGTFVESDTDHWFHN